MKEICPRCKSETFELGTPIIKVGKTREMRVAIRECPKCTLIFYERKNRKVKASKAYLNEAYS